VQDWRRISLATFKIRLHSSSTEIQNSSNRTTLNFSLRVLSLRSSRKLSLTGKDSFSLTDSCTLAEKKFRIQSYSSVLMVKKQWSYFWCNNIKCSWPYPTQILCQYFYFDCFLETFQLKSVLIQLQFFFKALFSV